MKSYDIVVIGGGSGLLVASEAARCGRTVAIIEKGPLGGTCLNRGCIPSKILIHSADVAETISSAKKFGITAKISEINFKKITARASSLVDAESREIEAGITQTKNMTLYKSTAAFLGQNILQAGNQKIKGAKIVIAAGTRTLIPPIAGLDKVPYITSTEALRLKKQPRHLAIIGGGYIAAELAHFFGSLGTAITIIQRNDVLLPNTDREIAVAYTKIAGKKYTVLLEHTASHVQKKAGRIVVYAKGKKQTKKIIADTLLLAAGRIPNSDLLNLKAAGIAINKLGYILSNDYLETGVPNIWVLGDIAGKYFFKHSANLEAQYVIGGALYGRREAVNYTAMPFAVFSSPQIAGVGATQEELSAQKIEYAVGRYRYINSGMGTAIQDTDGFVKIMAGKKDKKILGCFILGTDAATVIHEVVLAMRNNLTVDALTDTIHIHPALSEIVARAVKAIEW